MAWSIQSNEWYLTLNKITVDVALPERYSYCGDND